ncbi:SDR family NAD(P)-dependent oxidoreductase [Reinekea sp. G2M2-21]|uniref:SDR family NAD(P)-dependent oxidoreductase n=1 Tax=Reinekea sp. G2M2-21 TaxID=2788942 RepID=UPI0018AC3DAF|nr:SDR family oxidoreductase [Reinekea sp. G2M2-21]
MVKIIKYWLAGLKALCGTLADIIWPEQEQNLTESEQKTQRVALVTGSTSGIGKAIAERLANDGYRVMFHSRHSVEAGNVLAETVPNACYIQADLAQPEQITSLIQQILVTHGRLDVLINNAAISAVIPHGDMQLASADVWRKMYDVNVIAPWLLIAEAEAALRNAATEQHSSCIVNVSSHAGVRPKGASIPYAVSKAALNHMTKLLAVNLSPLIRVNAVAPGLVDTPMTKDWHDARALWRDKSPMQRGAQAEEIADIVAMLVHSSYLTGEVILCDGGLNLV